MIGMTRMPVRNMLYHVRITLFVTFLKRSVTGQCYFIHLKIAISVNYFT